MKPVPSIGVDKGVGAMGWRLDSMGWSLELYTHSGVDGKTRAADTSWHHSTPVGITSERLAPTATSWHQWRPVGNIQHQLAPFGTSWHHSAPDYGIVKDKIEPKENWNMTKWQRKRRIRKRTGTWQIQRENGGCKRELENEKMRENEGCESRKIAIKEKTEDIWDFFSPWGGNELKQTEILGRRKNIRRRGIGRWPRGEHCVCRRGTGVDFIRILWSQSVFLTSGLPHTPPQSRSIPSSSNSTALE